MNDTKIEKRFVYDGFGFELVFLNVPMLKVRGFWTPKLDYNKLARKVALAVARKPSRLTGNEIRFLRHHFEMTSEAFGKRFDVTHPAVLKWESAGKRATAMKWTTEKEIRLFVLDELHVKPKDFMGAYQSLRDEAPPKPKPIEMDVATAAA